jgi:hypothetical protein
MKYYQNEFESALRESTAEQLPQSILSWAAGVDLLRLLNTFKM